MSPKLHVLDLFAGIGGFSYGLEQTGGFKTSAFCEADVKARAVLAKHWPDTPIYHDVRDLTGTRLREDNIHVDVITGGFPCQDISLAGKGAGLEGQRSGLWYEFRRLIDETRPQWVIIENVSALRSRGLDEVLRSLAEIGYNAEWHCIPAAAVGAPHRRDRIWIVAHPCIQGLEGQRIRAISTGKEVSMPSSSSRIVRSLTRSSQWQTEPAVGRVANGVPGRVDRLKQLGNAVVPQIPHLIGMAILGHIREQSK